MVSFPFCVALTLVGLFSLTGSASSSGKGRRQVLMLSFDGFRWDYIDHYSTPNFDEFKKDGVWVKHGVTPAFTTKTFPDHYTMATGLYEESHGIVGNEMYDPVFNETFNMSNTETKWWDDGEPIWITTKLQGLKSGCFFWPGSTVKIKNTLPDFSLTYNQSIEFNDRVDTMVEWLENKVDLVVGYFHEPDSAGHKYGAMSIGVGDVLKNVDDTLGYLISKLKMKNLYDKIDIILVSDHGMTNVTMDKTHVIVLRDHLDLKTEVAQIVQDGPVVSIRPNTGMKDVVYDKLKGISNITVYKKENIPDRYRYKEHRRILDIQVFADEGFHITKKPPSKKESSSVFGNHGYDNRLPSMRPIFMARGPDFKKNYISEGFETVDIYPLVCHLLGIQPSPNNGSLENVKHMLSSGEKIRLSSIVVLQIIATCLVSLSYM